MRFLTDTVYKESDTVLRVSSSDLFLDAMMSETEPVTETRPITDEHEQITANRQRGQSATTS